MRCLPFGLLLAALALAACQVAGGPLGDLPPALPRPTPTADVSIFVSSPPTAPAVALPTDISELSAGQHLSARGSYSDTETLAAGPMFCQIQRDTLAFQHLALYSGADVLFSGSEPPPYGAEDRLMHPAAVPRLAKLAELARAAWGPEAQLMVTEAYDSRLSHDVAQPNALLKYSLHFEGRSLDVIPWPPDNAGRLGRLCALAHQAGFDWVHNEGDHCHLSVEAESLCVVYGAEAP